MEAARRYEYGFFNPVSLIIQQLITNHWLDDVYVVKSCNPR